MLAFCNRLFPLGLSLKKLLHKRHYEKFADGTITDVEDELTFEVPEGWSIIHLQHIGNFQGGQTPKSDETTDEGTIPYFKVSDMNVPGNEHYMNKVSLYLRDSAKYKVFPPDSIIYPKNGGAVFTNKKRILTVNSLIDLNTGAYIPSNLVDNKYAYYLFSTIDFNKFYKGTSVPTVDHDSICELFFGLPPLVEQKEIVKQLSEVFKNIDIVEEDKSILLETVSKAKSKILDLAIHGKLVPQDPNDEPASVLLEKLRAEKEEKIAKSELKRDKNDSYIYKGSDNCYYEKFVDGTIHQIDVPFDLPYNWSWCKLNELANISRGGSPRPIENYITTDIDGINWIKIGDTSPESKYIIGAKEKIKPSGIKHSRFVHSGDFLLTNSMSFGRPYILKINGCIHDGWLVFSDIKSCLDQDYLYYALSSKYIYNAFSLVAAGSTVKNLKSDTVKQVIFPIPPIEEQKRIVLTIDKLFTELKQIQNNFI